MNVLRNLLLALGVIGALAFAAAFIASFINPLFVENIAREVIKREVENRVHEKIDALDDKFLAGKAAQLVKGYGDEVAALQRQLKEKVPEKLTVVIAEMGNLNCECRKKVEAGLRDGLQVRILSATAAQERLTALIRTKYMEAAEKLTREFRVFTGTNAIVFALLALAVFVKPRAGLHLVPAALVLVVAAALTGCLYLFNQDWLHTILFGDYVGFAYVGYMSIAFALLCDLLLNRARITARILNALLQMVGSVASIAPC
ncbi:MAG: hypothetical protein JNN20_18515 [Betaproteobacteria bacterium]|nr:hypothetical protein [Betaproteobacteria bacterium]